MTSKEHHKHPKLARPGYGFYARQEWALVGAPCSTIQTLSGQIIEQLSARFACAYLDANHQPVDMPNSLKSGATMDYIDAIDFKQFNTNGEIGPFQFRALFNDLDFVLVNGNHHEAAAQIVLIDPDKKDSLHRKLNRLTNVKLLIIKGDTVTPFDFLNESIPDLDAVPRVYLQDIDDIVSFFEKEMTLNTATLNGLVLAGGQSQRMGQDKGLIEWHGVPQREHLASLLGPLCESVFISCREDQLAGIPEGLQALPDTFSGLGPFGAILSAFRAHPDCAWLVAACDLPLLDKSVLEHLIQSRCVKKIATAYRVSDDAFPEPLITIWEPKAYAVLLSFLAQGYSCPRKVLINANAEVITAPNPEALQNVNSREDFEKMLTHPAFSSQLAIDQSKHKL
ncbi:MAG: NTP transferase domain-containing protein [Saprospiraceae bacterium]